MSLVRLISRKDEKPVVRVKERHDSNVIFLFWPRNPNYEQALETANKWMANCLTQAIEAPKPA